MHDIALEERTNGESTYLLLAFFLFSASTDLRLRSFLVPVRYGICSWVESLEDVLLLKTRGKVIKGLTFPKVISNRKMRMRYLVLPFRSKLISSLAESFATISDSSITSRAVVVSGSLVSFWFRMLTISLSFISRNTFRCELALA